MGDNAFRYLESTLHLIAVVACGFVLMSFALFVVDNVSTASHHQAALIAGSGPVLGAAPPSTTPAKPKGHDGARRTVDSVAHALESPFSAVVSGTNSQWARVGFETFVAVLIYGFGVGYLARRVRVHR